MVKAKLMDLPSGPALSYIEHGDPLAPPVILLHGVSDSCHSFVPLLQLLPPSLHVFAISQRGHGDSERPRLGYGPQEFAADLNAFMEVANLRPAIVVGHSMGSSVAERFALDYPEHVSRLILAGAFRGGWQTSPAAVDLWNSTISAMTDPVDADFVHAFQRSTLAQPVPPAFLDVVVRESLKLPARVWRAVFESFLGSDFSAELGAISVPTLIVWGARDTICPRNEQEALARAIPYARLVVYDDAGHAPHWEEPARFAGDLVDFVEIIVGSVRGWAADAGTSVPRFNTNDECGTEQAAGRTMSMAVLQDIRGNPLTGADDGAAAAYIEGLTRFNLFIGDPVASAEAATASAPGFVMGHVLRAWLLLLSTEAPPRIAAREAWLAARDLPMTTQEAGHVAAIGHLLDGRWHQAARVLEDVSIAHPRDLLALQVGHQLDFFTGQARMLRDRVARALPAWSPELPGRHALLGMLAFGLEEMGDYAAAEVAGRDAISLERRDAWAQHAVAHVMEMQGRTEDGIAWMRADTPAWAEDNFFAVHNWWHLALYHLEIGEIEEVLRLFDGPIHGARSCVMIDMVDAAALLWRLHLRGVDVGERWQSVADGFAPTAGAGNYAFNDLHAMMAFTGADRRDLADQVLSAQHTAMGREDDNAAFTREVGHPATRAIRAFGEGRYDEVVRLLRGVRSIAHRFGGSHAQRDVLDLTLLEAAFRSGQHDLAKALAAERVAAKPASPLAALFSRRAHQATAN